MTYRRILVIPLAIVLAGCVKQAKPQPVEPVVGLSQTHAAIRTNAEGIRGDLKDAAEALK